MTEENTGCVVDLTRNDPARYKRMMDLVRNAGGNHAWTRVTPAGDMSCWTLGRTVLLVQQIGNSVEVYTNSVTPNTWEDIETWLGTL